MHGSQAIELVLVLLAAVSALALLARRLGVPDPILLVVGGLALALVPGLPHVELQPDLVFLLFLPPLLYQAAIWTSLRDFRANLRPITLLAVGAVLSTMVGVAVAAHYLVGLPWAVAFVLGAIVSPPDAVAATAMAERLGIPRRLVVVLEGESLVNDATALVAYRLAVAAVVTGTFSLAQAPLRVVLVGVGGVLLGLAVGWLIHQVRRRLYDPPVENTISLLTPFAAYLPAEALGLSGVLAVVTTGLFLGRRAPQTISSRTRVQAVVMWQQVIFVLQGLIFILIGLQLRSILEDLGGYATPRLLWYGAAISLVVILVRFLWVYPAAYLPRYWFPAVRARDPYPPWQLPFVVSWIGMRGVVSLAAALALPYVTDSGAPFPARELVLFLTFCVIFVTLVVQGLSLPAVLRWLGVGAADDGVEREESKARLKAAQAALATLDQLAREEWVEPEAVDRLRAHYGERKHRLHARYDPANHPDDDDHETHASVYERLKRELLGAERRTIIELRDRGLIADEVLHRIERDLDLEELRLEAPAQLS